MLTQVSPAHPALAQHWVVPAHSWCWFHLSCWVSQEELEPVWNEASVQHFITCSQTPLTKKYLLEFSIAHVMICLKSGSLGNSGCLSGAGRARLQCWVSLQEWDCFDFALSTYKNHSGICICLGHIVEIPKEITAWNVNIKLHFVRISTNYNKILMINAVMYWQTSAWILQGKLLTRSDMPDNKYLPQHSISFLSSQLANTYYFCFCKWLVCLTPEVAVFPWHIEVILKLII